MCVCVCLCVVTRPGYTPGFWAKESWKSVCCLSGAGSVKVMIRTGDRGQEVSDSGPSMAIVQMLVFFWMEGETSSRTEKRKSRFHYVTILLQIKWSPVILRQPDLTWPDLTSWWSLLDMIISAQSWNNLLRNYSVCSSTVSCSSLHLSADQSSDVISSLSPLFPVPPAGSEVLSFLSTDNNLLSSTTGLEIHETF